MPPPSECSCRRLRKAGRLTACAAEPALRSSSQSGCPESVRLRARDVASTRVFSSSRPRNHLGGGVTRAAFGRMPPNCALIASCGAFITRVSGWRGRRLRSSSHRVCTDRRQSGLYFAGPRRAGFDFLTQSAPNACVHDPIRPRTDRRSRPGLGRVEHRGGDVARGSRL